MSSSASSAFSIFLLQSSLHFIFRHHHHSFPRLFSPLLLLQIRAPLSRRARARRRTPRWAYRRGHRRRLWRLARCRNRGAAEFGSRRRRRRRRRRRSLASSPRLDLLSFLLLPRRPPLLFRRRQRRLAPRPSPTAPSPWPSSSPREPSSWPGRPFWAEATWATGCPRR